MIRGFEPAAVHYDGVSSCQRLMAGQLAQAIARQCAPLRSAVDIGCGTGHLAEQLLDQLDLQELTLVDLSPAMLERCRAKLRARATSTRLSFVRADAQTMDPASMQPSAPFDLCASSAALHWLDDLPSFLQRMARAMRPGSVLAFNSFGQRTLIELRESYQKVHGFSLEGGAHLRSMEEVTRLCRAAGWCVTETTSERWEPVYPNLRALLGSLHGMGASFRPGRRRLTPRTWRAWQRVYEDAYSCPGGVAATWQWHLVLAYRMPPAAR